MVTQILNHEDLAADRLFYQYQNSENIHGTLSSIVKQVQDIEDMSQPMYYRLVISQMSGVQLDLIGELVGLKRSGLPDTMYRIRLYSQIAVNNSTGIRENVIQFMKIIAGSREGFIWILESYPASFQVNTSILFTQSELLFIKLSILLIKPLGVRFNGLIYEPPTGNIFTYADDGNVPKPNSAGYGDLDDPSVGGQYTTIF